ncbi:hypothetical protein, partial [Heyndrickxia oleronia]|uniref:hypothetical protein n=1 Tax=Heyndrickxia oleronia TaxID=38875 RepID=UPI0024318CC6
PIAQIKLFIACTILIKFKLNKLFLKAEFYFHRKELLAKSFIGCKSRQLGFYKSNKLVEKQPILKKALFSNTVLFK